MFGVLTKNLQKRGYKVSEFPTAEDAIRYLIAEINGKTIGFGGSITLEETGLCGTLERTNTVYWHRGLENKELKNKMLKLASTADIYISSVNAIAQTGEIVNIDGNGNRISSMLYGHEKVYLMIGKNKITKNCENAVNRARTVAAPQNARRLGNKTPCAKDEICHNCKSRYRICRVLNILWGPPTSCEYEILLINEDLGF